MSDRVKVKVARRKHYQKPQPIPLDKIIYALRRNKWNRAAAARSLGMRPNTLYQRLLRSGIDLPHRGEDYVKPVSLKITQEAFDAVGAYAKAHGVTKVDVMRDAIDEYLERNFKDEQET